ncbi:MAG: hypothetical protein ACW981_19765 [Candidatus Hodarchaeales archaeon]
MQTTDFLNKLFAENPILVSLLLFLLALFLGIFSNRETIISEN